MSASIHTRMSSTMGPMSPSSRRVSGLLDTDSMSNGGMSQSFYQSHGANTLSTGGMRESFYQPRGFSSRRISRGETTSISNVVSSLRSRSGDELGPAASSQLFGASHASLLEWIRTQRMTLLPPEGSDYDKVLAWAQLFVERLHSFDHAIEEFAADSYLASQLAYGHCAMLLELGRENASALTASFGFFHSISMPFLNLLERTELFNVSQEIRELLSLAMGDLVSLVASVSIHFQKAINGLGTSSVSIDIYRTFSDQIQTFRQRCDKVSVSLWRHQLLKENVEVGRVTEIDSIKSWLTPDDRIVASIADSTSHLAHERQELTCLWIGPYLTRFLKSPSKNLAIAGPAGSGKTVLASVVVDHLQHPIGGVSYNTIYLPINTRIPAGTYPSAIASSILLQLLGIRIGNVQLFQILSDAFKRSKLVSSQEEYDNLVWGALEKALASSLQGAKDLVLVVDGVDESSCGETALVQKLVTATSNVQNVKLITFGAERPRHTEQQEFVSVSKDLVFDDVSSVTRKHLMVKGVFSTLDEMDQETVVSRITDVSNGSFLWSKLAAKKIRDVTSLEAFHKAVDALVSSKPTILDFVSQAVQESDVSHEAKQMLLWLATAERPLQVKELSILASVQLEKLSVSEKETDVLHHLRPLTSLVFLEDDLIYLRHGTIRSSILDVFNKGKLVSNVKDPHTDLAARMLVYIKATNLNQRDISLDSLSWHDTSIMLSRNVLLDFALRYWPKHFTTTTTYLKDGPSVANKEFSKILPTSISAVQLQNTIWQKLPTPAYFKYTSTVFSAFKDVLTLKNVVTLQALVFMTQLTQQLNRPSESLSLSYQAATTSYTVLTTSHIVTMQLMRTFLDLTSDQVTESKTDIMTKRVECLEFLVECYKVHYGATSESVVTVMKQLVEHYRLVKEVKKAEELEDSIKKITHTETEVTNGTSDSQLAVLLKARETKEAQSTKTLVLDVEEDEQIVSERHYDFEGSLTLAQKYVSEGRFDLAEHTYVEMWQKLANESRTSVSEEKRSKAILDYSKFLKSQKRDYDASSLLHSFWQDYQHFASQSETSALYFQEIAKVMKTVGLSATALSVFKSCSQYYKSTQHTQSSSYKELQQVIETTSTELMKSLSTSTVLPSESTLEQMVYDATKSISTVNQDTFAAIHKLTQIYTSQHRWRDTTRMLKRVLRGIWPSLFASSLEDVTLSTKYVENCVGLAEQLSQCYRSRRRSAKEGGIRLRIYRCLRSGRPVEDKLRQQATEELLRFYSTTSQTDPAINIHQELLNDYTEHYGPENPVVIKELWTLAELARPRSIFLDYYQKIITILNKGSKTSHPDAFEPTVTMVNEFWRQGRYSDAVNLFSIIFTTFLEQDKVSPKLKDGDFVQDMFNRYTHCLRSVRTEFTTLHKITTAYQSKCKTVFGKTSSVTIQATVTLAKLCQESKRYESEAIALYEELSKIDSDVINRDEITATLNSFYEEQEDDLSFYTGRGSASSAQVQKTVQTLKKRVTTVRQTYGWAHEESLTKMKEMVSMYAQSNEIHTAVSELNEATVQVLSSATSSTALASAASAIASSYISIGQTKKVTELSDEVYRQILMKDTSNAKSVKFDLSSKEHQSLIFLAQLQHSLSRGATSLTEILASLTTEFTYFEEFRRETKSKSSKFHSVLLSASRLHSFLVDKNRTSTASRVLVDLRNYFLATEGKKVKVTDTNQADEFVLTMVEYLTVRRSSDLARSVGIAANARVVQLLKLGKFDAANNLAIAAYRYITSQESYHTSGMVKFIFILGMNISGRGQVARPKPDMQQKLLATSSVIIQDALRVVDELKLNLALMDTDTLNSLVGLLGEQKDHKTLAWLLTMLWNSREVQRNWQASTTLALGRRFIMARYLVGDTMAAVRLAEDVVYNCRRVHGVRHSSTLEMSTLLSQLYTGVAQKYQAHKDGAELAKRYYKKSAAIHENILRAFSDPAMADMDANLDGTMSLDGNSLDLDFGEQAVVNPGEHVRGHLQLLKLSIERLGDWPKDYAEYERLNADLFREFPQDLKGVAGVEKWNPKAFGAGKAESGEDQLDADFKDWQLFEAGSSGSSAYELAAGGANGVEEEL